MDWSIPAGLAVAWSLVATAEAQVAQVAPFSTRCTETEATGFNWEKGKWVRVNFTPAVLLVQKLDPSAHAGATNLCDAVKPPEQVVLDTFASLSGCYSATEPSDQPLFEWCDEYYEKVDGQWRLDSVGCLWIGRNLSFKPDGAFVLSMDAADLSDKPDDDYKDSLKIGHGRCRVVNPP
jgi:hypothetical protein